MFALVRATDLRGRYSAEIIQLSGDQVKVEGEASRRNEINRSLGIIQSEMFFVVEVAGEEPFDMVQVLRDSNLFFI